MSGAVSENHPAAGPEAQPRRAEPRDVPAMAAIVFRWVEATDWYITTDDRGVLEGHIGNAFPDREMWVAGEPVIAYASFHPAREYLGALYSDVKGRGIGRALLDAVRAGREHVWLTSHVANTAAQRFYTRAGFVITGEQIAEPPGEPLPVYRMEWNR